MIRFSLLPGVLFAMCWGGAVAGAPVSPIVSDSDDHRFLRSLAPDSTDPSEVARLLSELGDPEFQKRETAFAALKMLHQIPESLLEEADRAAGPDSKHRIAAILKALGDRLWKARARSLLYQIHSEKISGFALEILGALPTLEDAGLTISAHDVLRTTATAADVPLLADAFDSRDIRIRESVLSIVSRFDLPASEEVLHRALADEVPEIRLAAALALAEKSDPACLLPLAELLTPPSAVEDRLLIRHRASDALRRLTGEKFEYDVLKPDATAAAAWKSWIRENPSPRLKAFKTEPPRDLLADGVSRWPFFKTVTPDPFGDPETFKREGPDPIGDPESHDPFNPGGALAKKVSKITGIPAGPFFEVAEGGAVHASELGWLQPPLDVQNYRLTFDLKRSKYAARPKVPRVPFGGGGGGPFARRTESRLILMSSRQLSGEVSGVCLSLYQNSSDLFGELNERSRSKEFAVDWRLVGKDPGTSDWPRNSDDGWDCFEFVVIKGVIHFKKNGESVSVISGLPEERAGILLELGTGHFLRRLRVLPLPD